MITGGSESCHFTTTLSMLKRFFDKLQSNKYLVSIHFHQQAISITSHLSFTMQKQCLITDIVDTINKGKEMTMELQSSKCKLPLPSVTNKDSNVKIAAAAMNLPANQTFKNQNHFLKNKKPNLSNA